MGMCRGGDRNDHLAGGQWNPLSGIHWKEDQSALDGEGAPGCKEWQCERAVVNGLADGAAVLHYGDWQYGHAGGEQRIRKCLCIRFYGRHAYQTVHNVSV